MSLGRILVFAYSEVGHACLNLLIERNLAVVGVFTHEDNPNEKQWFPSVSELAKSHGIPVYKIEQSELEKNIPVIESLKPDLLFSFYYRFIIPDAILKIPKLGAFNMHGSLLPKFRGCAPVNWAVIKGEKETGATLHVMTQKADDGDIVDSESVPIDMNDSAGAVQTLVTKAAVSILTRQIDNLLAGKAPLTPQNSKLATKFGRRKPEDGEIDWNGSAQDIHNLIRGVSHPYPGATTDIFGANTYIWESRLSDTAATSERPGELKLTTDELIVFCGDGKGLVILRAQLEGEKELDGIDFMNDLFLNKRESGK